MQKLIISGGEQKAEESGSCCVSRPRLVVIGFGCCWHLPSKSELMLLPNRPQTTVWVPHQTPSLTLKLFPHPYNIMLVRVDLDLDHLNKILSSKVVSQVFWRRSTKPIRANNIVTKKIFFLNSYCYVMWDQPHPSFLLLLKLIIGILS